MNFVTALLDRLVPGRGGAEAADDEDSPREPAEDRSTPVEDAPTDPGENGMRMRPDPPADIADEDMVLRQLIAHGGRISRSTLADETGWNEEALDDVLRGMERDSQISTINRRDPLVCRRGFEPAGAPLRFKND